MRAIKKSIADARREREADAHRDAPGCTARAHHGVAAPLAHHGVAAPRAEPCPRVLPSRTLFDGSIVRHLECDGACVRAQRRAARATVGSARRDLQLQVAVTVLLAIIAAGWVMLAAREASADRFRDDELAEDAELEVAPPPVLEAPFGPGTSAPAIEHVLAAAYRTAGLDRDLGRGFVRRSRLAGLVPWLSVRTGRDTSWRDDTPDVARGVTVEVRATWRLDRLVFDGRELQVAALDAARRRERRRLASRVIQVYFGWKRAIGTSRGAARAEEAAAELDDLTNGWFTEARGAPDGGAPSVRRPDGQ